MFIMAAERAKDEAIEPVEPERADEDELSTKEMEGVSGGYDPANTNQNSNWASHHSGGDGSGSHYGE